MQKNKAAGKEKSIFGFTLLEIMIVVAVIGLLAAIAIPNIIRMRMTANEGSAEATLKTMVTAMESYRAAQSTPAFPTQFDSLTSPTSPPSYLEATLTNPTTFDKSGYRFQLLSTGTNTYLVHGSPVTANQTGKNYFCADQSGEVQKSEVAFMTDQTKCREVCGAGEEYDSGSDACHADCTGGTSWNSETSSCACPSGQESDGTICHDPCDEGETWNSVEAECEGDDPECSGGRTWDGDSCECPSGQTMLDLGCFGDPTPQCVAACASGLGHNSGGSCVSTDCSAEYGAGVPYISTFVEGCGCYAQNCPTNTFNDGEGNCVACNGGYVSGGQCMCSGTYSSVCSTCFSCYQSQIVNESTCACECPSGQIWDGSYSVCHENCGVGRSWDGDSCECQSGLTWDGDSCECPSGGPGWNGSACACSSGQIWDAQYSSCHEECLSPRSWDGDSCDCPSPGPSWNGMACECPGGGAYWDSSCNVCFTQAGYPGGGPPWDSGTCSYACPSGQEWSSPQGDCHAPCTGGQSWNGNECECPGDQLWEGGDSCHYPCPHPATWDGSTCACPSHYGDNNSEDGCDCLTEDC